MNHRKFSLTSAPSLSQLYGNSAIDSFEERKTGGKSLVSESLVSKVEIHVSCSSLQDRDYLSKSDPMVVLFVELPKGNDKLWKEYDRTEAVKDDLNPRFMKSFIIEYYFEIHQKLRFVVYDKDSSSDELKEHDFLGMVDVSLGCIIGERGSVITKHLFDKKNQKLKSKISFTAEELVESKEMITLQFKARKLERKDFFSPSDPYLMFSRCAIEGSEYTPVYRTEHVKNNSNPMWKKFTIPVSILCNGDKHRPIRIDCFHHNSGNDVLIGSCNTSISDLMRGGENTKWLINETKQNNKRNYRHSGELTLHYIELRNKASFLDYISNGLQLCFHVAVDFTASNGNPIHSSSLHYLENIHCNQYAQALYHVGRICEDYDSDKMIAAYGFGAKVRGQVQHSFPLNFSRHDPHCFGIDGVITAYQEALRKVEFFGPTNFSPVLNIIIKMVEKQTAYDQYHVLLILTDGLISDMSQTKTALIRASRLPISVLIVGVGNANFSSMIELDSDNSLLSYLDQTAERDIVQFVPYQKYSGSFPGVDLAKEVLYEVPEQLTSFMEDRGITPEKVGSPVTAQDKQRSRNSKNYSSLPRPKNPRNEFRERRNSLPSHVTYESGQKTAGRKLSAKEFALSHMKK